MSILTKSALASNKRRITLFIHVFKCFVGLYSVSYLSTGARKAIRDRRISVKKTETANGGGVLRVDIKSLQCEDGGIYQCSIDSYDMWPVETTISIISKL